MQPNIISRDRKADMRVGEFIRVTRTGLDRLHNTKRELFRVG